MITVVLVVVLLLAAAGAALWGFWPRGARPLPHRPAPDTPPAPGPRHRIEHAHTGSFSATELRAALDAAANTKGT